MKKFKTVDEILDFAIERELEAIDFYNDLVEKAEKPWIKDMFRRYAVQEKGHASKLKNIKSSGKMKKAEGQVLDLKISDYLVDVEANDVNTYEKALILGIKKEKAAYKLYNNLVKIVDDPELKNVFEILALEEAKHKLDFEIEYDEYVYKEN